MSDEPAFSVTVEPDLSQVFARYPEIANRHFQVAMKKATLDIVAEVRPRTPVFQSRLRNSINSEVTGVGMNIVGRVGSSIDSPYPSVMEFGRRPGSRPPPAASLERWVYLVLGVPQEDALSVAFQIARSIGIKGIKGHYFMRDGFNAAKPKVIERFNTALADINREVVNGA